MTKFVEDFKKFIMRGNAVDLAVGIIIGGAFGKIISSLVEDILMPPIGKLIGGVGFNDLFINLSDKNYSTLAEAKQAGALTLNYGLFFNRVIDFLLIGLSIFLVVKFFNKLQKKEALKNPTEQKTATEIQLLTEIRDALKAKK